MKRALVRKASAGGGTPYSGILQRRSNGRSQPAAVPPIVHDVLRSPGQPLDAATRAYMEPRFGYDFSKVRVHADGRAAEAADSIGARAFTSGRSIAFGGGEHTPQMAAGRRLLAHELAHIVQQPASHSVRPTTSLPLIMGDADDRTEGEANHAVDSVARGSFVRHLSQSPEVVIRRQLKTMAPQEVPEDDAINKGCDEVEKLVAKYQEKTYKAASKPGEFDPEATKDAASIKAALTEDGQKYLRSEAGRSFLKSLQSHPEGHALAQFSKSWLEGEARIAEALADKDGQAQVFALIAPLWDKTYKGKSAPSKQEPPSESRKIGVAYPPGDSEYDPAAVKDCFAIVTKLTKEARSYLASNAGKAFLKHLEREPEGHALWLFAGNWRASEPLVTNEELIDRRDTARFEKRYGKPVGDLTHKLVKERMTDEKLGGYAKRGAKPGVDAVLNEQKKKIEAKKQNDPTYTTALAAKDLADLEKAQEVIGEIEDDASKLRTVKRVFSVLQRVSMRPEILEGILIGLAAPTSVTTTPGAEQADTAAGHLVKKLMSTEAPQNADIPFSSKEVEGKPKKLEGKVGFGTAPFTPNKILSGEEKVTPGMFRDASGELTVRFGTEAKLYTVNTKNKYMFPAPGTSAGESFKGGTGLDFANKMTGKSFVGKTDYEFKQGELNVSASQKFGEKEDFALLSQAFKKNQTGTETSVGVDVKHKMFEQSLKLNLPRNPAGQPVNETAKMGLGIQFPKTATDKSKTLSLDANITMNLAGEEHVKALASFLEYKDPKHFIDICVGYQLEHSGHSQKEDLSLALKTTWSKYAAYLGTSFGMTEGKPARGEAVAGMEMTFDKGRSKYGIFLQEEFSHSDVSGGHDQLLTTFGLKRDKSRLGVYISDLSPHEFGLKYSLTFDPAKFKAR